MKTANVAMLKQHLSHYLRLVEAGQDVMVTSHRRPVARLTPAPDHGINLRSPTRPVADLLTLRRVAPVPRPDIVKMLEEERRRR